MTTNTSDSCIDNELMLIASILARDTLDKQTKVRDILNERAIDYLTANLEVLRAVIGLRTVGKFEVSQREADQLVTLGIMQVDGQGYYMSEVVEDLIDWVLKKTKEPEVVEKES